MRSRAHVLVVDADEPVCARYRRMLEPEGLSVHMACNGRQALDMLSRRSFDLVVLDLTVPGMKGMDVLQRITARYARTGVIVVTGDPTVQTAVEAMRLGAADVVPKPLSDKKMHTAVRKALAWRGLGRGNRSHAGCTGPPEIVGQTARMRNILRSVQRVAPTDSTVLIMGASGTGKELIARAVHHGSRRAGGPFVVVDCATLVGMLFENELFGHVKGSYTGAISTTHGRFELADGGTLFLDEVGCLDTRMQQKLLRVLEQREFTRVGSNQVISVDVRLVAATNTDLTESVAAGTFREDLYYRLSVFPIVLPPLRKRKADIPALAEHFLRLHRCEHQKDVDSIHPHAMAMLVEHDWPGNVRELSNAIERAVVLAEGSRILPCHLPSYRLPASGPAERLPGRTLTLAEVERTHIEQVLGQTNGNRRRAAELLGIDRKTLWRKLQRYASTAP
jgi:two-component system response regulator HydG